MLWNLGVFSLDSDISPPPDPSIRAKESKS
jgi:hypothetical protein